MAAVLLIALALGLGLPAWEVFRDKELHAHVWIQRREEITKSGNPYTTGLSATIPSPFWPRYARHLLGRPWKQQPLCRPLAGQFELYCEFEHPDICYRREGRFQMVSVGVPPTLWPVLNRMNGKPLPTRPSPR